MATIVLRLRPLLIGLVVLLITAGIAFAGRPSTPANGPAVASEASSKVVPVGPVQQGTDRDANANGDATEAAESDTDSNVPAVDQTDSDQDAPDNCATDPSGLTPEQLADLRHGSVVCWAAQQATPAGYDNHGQWVSEWARKNRGQTIRPSDQAVTSGQEQAADRPGKGNAKKP